MLSYIRPSDFGSLFKVRNVTGALIMTFIEHMEKMTHVGIEPGSSYKKVVCLYRSTKALTFYLEVLAYICAQVNMLIFQNNIFSPPASIL